MNDEDWVFLKSLIPLFYQVDGSIEADERVHEKVSKTKPNRDYNKT